jgi:hypothetical protein
MFGFLYFFSHFIFFPLLDFLKFLFFEFLLIGSSVFLLSEESPLVCLWDTASWGGEQVVWSPGGENF